MGPRTGTLLPTLPRQAGNMEKPQPVFLWTSFPWHFVKRNYLFLNYSVHLHQHRHCLKRCFQAIPPFPSAFFGRV